MLKRISREPLLHFLLIGACLFALYAWLNPDAQYSQKKIIVGAGQIDSLKARFQKAWYRDPTEDELARLIDNFIIEEIYYREALQMGIDKDDPVIRRRLYQKMEFFSDTAAAAIEATDEQLSEFLQSNPEKFKTDAVFSFQQVYLSPDRSAAELEQVISETQRALAQGEPVTADQTLLPERFSDTTKREINRVLGKDFSAQLATLPLDTWSPPLKSGLGIHFVKLSARQQGQLPPLAQVREQVLREWRYQKQQQLDKAMKDRLLANYDIVIDYPSAGSEG